MARLRLSNWLEENPEQSLSASFRIRMIERYSPYKVVGPVYLLQRK